MVQERGQIQAAEGSGLTWPMRLWCGDWRMSPPPLRGVLCRPGTNGATQHHYITAHVPAKPVRAFQRPASLGTAHARKMSGRPVRPWFQYISDHPTPQIFLNGLNASVKSWRWKIWFILLVIPQPNYHAFGHAGIISKPQTDTQLWQNRIRLDLHNNQLTIYERPFTCTLSHSLDKGPPTPKQGLSLRGPLSKKNALNRLLLLFMFIHFPINIPSVCWFWTLAAETISLLPSLFPHSLLITPSPQPLSP